MTACMTLYQVNTVIDRVRMRSIVMQLSKAESLNKSLHLEYLHCITKYCKKYATIIHLNCVALMIGSRYNR